MSDNKLSKNVKGSEIHHKCIEKVGRQDQDLISIINLKDRQKGKVSSIQGDHKIIRRLLDMGITIGAIIRVIKIAPLNGPVEVAVRGSKLALGRDIATNVLVENIKEDKGG